MSGRQKWLGAGLFGILSFNLVLALAFQAPFRTEYHKWRLQSAKAKRDQCMSARLTRVDKLWLQITGKPTKMSTLNETMHKHEDALVKLGFLHREVFQVETSSNPEQTREALAELRSECPWQHVESVSGTNMVLTACVQGMEWWRKRARELGWRSRGT